MTGFARGRESGGGVRRIGRSSVILLMARIAQRAVQRVVVIDVAIGAQARRNRVIPRERESGAVVIERRVRPSACAMARIASLGEVRGHVIRIGRTLIVREVAADASPGA